MYSRYAEPYREITEKKKHISVVYKSVFRIRIRVQLDQYHLAGLGSGSTEENVDPDPGGKKIVINSHKEITYFV